MKSVNTDVAYDYIRKRILAGEFPPGHPLLTELLAAEIKVSRTPIRDALRKLETDGLVTIRAHHGASVKQMNLKEYREMSDLRLALESHAAGLAAKNHTDDDLAEMEYALSAMRGLTKRIIAADKEQPILAELMKEDIRFHIAIMVAARNDLMKREILRLHLLHRVVSGPGPTGANVPVSPKAQHDARRRLVQAKHEDIFEAVKRGDAGVAKREMEFHLQELIDHNLRLLSRPEAGVIARELSPEELLYSAQH
jgi:DNA-binding GntR family transcriptional regulator